MGALDGIAVRLLEIPLRLQAHLDEKEIHLAWMGRLWRERECCWESVQSFLHCLRHEYCRRIQRLCNSKWAAKEEPRILENDRYIDIYIIRVTNNTIWHLADQCSQLKI